MDTNVKDSLTLMECESYIFIYQDDKGTHIQDTVKDADEFFFDMFNLVMQEQFSNDNKKQFNAVKIIEILKGKTKLDKIEQKNIKKYNFKSKKLITYKSSINNLEGYKVDGTVRRIISLIKKSHEIKKYLLFINVNGKIVSLTQSQVANYDLLYIILKEGSIKWNIKVNRLLDLFDKTCRDVGASVITVYKGDKEAAEKDYLLAKLPLKNFLGIDHSINSFTEQLSIEREFKKILRKHSSSWYWSFLIDGNTGYILLPRVKGNYDYIIKNLYEATRKSADISHYKVTDFLSELDNQLKYCHKNGYFKYIKPDISGMNINGYMPSIMGRFIKPSFNTFERMNKHNNIKWISFTKNKDEISVFTNQRGQEVVKIFCWSLLASLPWNANMRALILNWSQNYKKMTLKYYTKN